MDRADCIAMACYRLMQLRAKEALDIEQKPSDFAKLYGGRKIGKNMANPFSSQKPNPFLGNNPFV